MSQTLLATVFLFLDAVLARAVTITKLPLTPTAINNAGEVVGVTQVGVSPGGQPINHAALYSDGTLTDLGALPGIPFELSGEGITVSGDVSTANAINNVGQVVGVSLVPGSAEGAFVQHAFLYSGGTMTDLGTLGGLDSFANGINDRGDVVGTSALSLPGLYHGFLCSNGTMTDLGSLGGANSGAAAINSAGDVVGGSETGVSVAISGGRNVSISHAFLFSNGTMSDLGTLPGTLLSGATAINDTGQVVGTSGVHAATIIFPGDFNGFFYGDGSMIDIGYPAAGMNNAGQVVGWGFGDFEHSTSTAFLYSNGSMTFVDLNTVLPAESGWNLSSPAFVTVAGRYRSGPTAINDFGQIVGEGIDPDGRVSGYLLDLDTLPCVSAQCALTLGPVDVACAGQVIPTGVAAKFGKADRSVQKTTMSPMRKTRKLLKRARKLLKEAGMNAIHAAKGNRHGLSSGCADALKNVAGLLAARIAEVSR